MAHRKKTTLRQLAEALGLTEHTVSRALRGLPGMSEETRRECVRMAQELGYRTKEMEQSLAADRIPAYPGKRRRFLFVSRSGWARPLHIDQLLLQGVQDRLSPFGHGVTASILPGGSTPGELEAWGAQQGIEYADGVFISPGLPEAAEQWLAALPLPRVLIGFPSPGCPLDSVVWDVADAIHLSVRHLLEQGHTRLLYIGRTLQPRGFRYRWQAYRDAMAENGLDHPELPQVSLQDLSGVPGGAEQFGALLAAVQPTALLCAVNEELDALYYACSRLGARIPEDYSLVGLETAPGHFIPDLTHPILPVYDAGARAADRMLWRIANPTLPYEHIRLRGGFHAGSTVLSCPR